MRCFHNIESRAWKRNARGLPIYTAYGGGERWHVTRESKRQMWRVYPVDSAVRYVGACRETLAEISKYLESFDR